MKKLMVLLLMIISILHLVSCEEPPKEEEKEIPLLNSVDDMIGQNKIYYDYYSCFIKTNKTSYEFNEEIEINLSLSFELCYYLGRKVFIELLEDDCFEVLSSSKYVVDVGNVDSIDYNFSFKIKAIKESLAVKNLTFKITTKLLIDPNESEDIYNIANPDEYIKYPHILFIVDEDGIVFSGEESGKTINVGGFVHNYDSHMVLMYYRLNYLYAEGKIGQDEYIRRLNLYLNNSLICRVTSYDFIYISPNLSFEIIFINEDFNTFCNTFDLIYFPNLFAVDMLRIAYESGYIPLDIYVEECKRIMQYGYSDSKDVIFSINPYFISWIPFEVDENELVKHEVYYIDTYINFNYDFKFDYDKLPFDIVIKEK